VGTLPPVMPVPVPLVGVSAPPLVAPTVTPGPDVVPAPLPERTFDPDSLDEEPHAQTKVASGKHSLK
jgi:hypothetical protein